MVKRICDRCGAEINPTSSATYVNVRGAYRENTEDVELCCSCGMRRWMERMAMADEYIKRSDALRVVQEYRKGQDDEKFMLCGVISDLTELIEDIPAWVRPPSSIRR